MQAEPIPAGTPVSRFAEQVEDVLTSFPATRLVVCPELHLFGSRVRPGERNAELADAAEPLDGPRVRSWPSSPATWASGWRPARCASAARTARSTTPR
ncbi:hypothetical protein ACFQ0B_42045 [Nonomuraea thailandensis]